MLTPRKAAHLTGEDIQATLYACLTSGQVIQVSGHEEKGGAWDAQGTGHRAQGTGHRARAILRFFIYAPSPSAGRMLHMSDRIGL